MSYLYSILTIATTAGITLVLFAGWQTIVNLREKRDAERDLSNFSEFVEKLNRGEVHQEEILKGKELP